ncbi:putative ABC transporter anion-binding protein [Escovopsis weberi]|uniref:Putative ABC transporter anion-binding protein n=1 Tax=Escovopsis weberi TaxID=150374 RepID=A0A0M9VWB3_ESCWE|nr:putative ABC transporter anion-binding protein [Escovopsis weberi]
MAILRNLVAAAALLLANPCAAQNPAAIYDGGYGNDTQVKLRIGNGGAGQSGLIEVLANAFIKDQVDQGKPKFSVAWYTSDTTYSIQYLKTGLIDVGITYVPAAEQIAIKQGIASWPSQTVFRDHFLLVGPKSNPAKLSESDDLDTMFSKIREAAEGPATTPPTRFLSRYDKSATNIKEALLWVGIGQTPWATTYSTWYHQYIAFPIQALTAAIVLEEYTITDRGTILSLDPALADRTVIYKAGGDGLSDPLLNPAQLLVGKKAPNPDMARAFASWLSGSKGQKIIANFKKNGQQLYTPAPPGLSF